MSDFLLSSHASSFSQEGTHGAEREGKKRAPEDDDQGVNEEFIPGYKKFFNSSFLSDLTLIVDGTKFKVHKLVLCTRSEYFSNLYRGNNWAESDKIHLRLNGEEPSTIEAMLKFMYGFEYKDCNDTGGSQYSPVLFQVKIYQAADKYFVSGLKEAAAKEITELMKSYDWGYPCLTRFSHEIHEVYSRTSSNDKTLRRTFLDAAINNIGGLYQDVDFLDVLEGTRGLITDLMCELTYPFMRLHEPSSRSPCERCEDDTAVITETGNSKICLHCGFKAKRRS